MPIDDPISALQSLNASDQRQRSPISRFAKQFLEIVKLLTPPGTEIPLAGLDAACEWVNRRAERNREEFVDVLAEEIPRHGTQIEHILATSERHQQFVQQEMPGLMLEALMLAERARAKNHRWRLAQALVHSIHSGPRGGVEVASEMLSLATAVSENDVRVLNATIEQTEAESRRQPYQDRYTRGMVAWDKVRDALRMEPDELESSGSKLQSLGLLGIRQPTSPDRTAFVVLEKGRQFRDYISGSF